MSQTDLSGQEMDLQNYVFTNSADRFDSSTTTHVRSQSKEEIDLWIPLFKEVQQKSKIYI